MKSHLDEVERIFALHIVVVQCRVSMDPGKNTKNLLHVREHGLRVSRFDTIRLGRIGSRAVAVEVVIHSIP